MFKKVVSLTLVTIFLSSFFAFPVAAAIPNSSETISTNANQVMIKEPEKRSISVFAAAIAAFGLTMKGMKEFGVFAKNHGWNYRYCQAAIVAYAGGLANPVGAGVYLVCFDNGWNSV